VQTVYAGIHPSKSDRARAVKNEIERRPRQAVTLIFAAPATPKQFSKQCSRSVDYESEAAMEQRVGRYQIGRKLGKGAMGVVYLAEDTLLNRQAAIKTVDFAADDSGQREFLRNRLLRDARAAAGLSHPNIVGVYDVFEEGDSAYLVLEYIDGETLADAINRTPVPDPAFVVGILRATASALDYTHSRGVVHRDIKPANIMIDRRGTPKIMDFGIARIADARTTTPTGMVMGTIEYMSPEQIKGESVDGRSDQFALGALAYRMLAGATMFGQHSLATLAYKTVNETPPPVSTRNSSLPPAVDAAISKALAKDPADRYATCGEFVNALAAAMSLPVLVSEAPTIGMTAPLSTAPQPAYSTMPQPAAHSTDTQPTALSPTPRPAPAKRNNTVLVVGLGVAAILVAGAVILHPWQKPAPAPAPAVQTAAASPTPQLDTQTASAPAVPAKVEKSTTTASDVAKPAAKPPQHAAASEPPATSDAGDDSAADGDAEEAPPKGVPPAALAAYRKGQELVKSHDFAPAIAAFSQALTLHPDWPSAVFARARTYQLSGQFAEAVPAFTQYLAVRPRGFRANAFRGLCLLRLKEDDRAMADFEQALSLNPNLASAHFGRGQVYVHRGGLKKAVADFDAAIAQSPDYALALRARGNAKRKLGDEAGAKADLARARQLMGN
jgi:serine/threonine protein kinase/Tfp pilus assembly protein PilF